MLSSFLVIGAARPRASWGVSSSMRRSLPAAASFLLSRTTNLKCSMIDAQCRDCVIGSCHTFLHHKWPLLMYACWNRLSCEELVELLWTEWILAHLMILWGGRDLEEISCPTHAMGMGPYVPYLYSLVEGGKNLNLWMLHGPISDQLSQLQKFHFSELSKTFCLSPEVGGGARTSTRWVEIRNSIENYFFFWL